MLAFLASRLPVRAVRPRTLFVAVALVPAIAQLVCFVFALARRLGYPMDLEWLEGPQLYEAFRFAHGLPVYGPPSQGFVPCPYPPGYHLVVAALGRGFGFDYWNGRLVSDVSIAVVVALIAAAVLRAAPSRRLGVVLAVMGAAGVAASYRPLEASLDLARVDMMGFAVVLVAARVARRRPLRGPRAVLLGVLLCAAVYTKQTNLCYVAWLLGFVAWRDRRGAALAGTVALALAVAALVALQRATGGWFWTWMMTMRTHGVVPEKCVVAGVLVVAGTAAVGSILAAFRRRGWLGEATPFWCGMLAASIPACVGPMLTGGGWINNLIGLTMLALLVALLLVCDALAHLPAHLPAPATAERWILATGSALLLGALYDPMANVPDATRRHDAEALHATIRALDGAVLAPMYPFVPVRDGKTTPQMSLVAYADTKHVGGPNADDAESIRSKDPTWVVLFGHAQEDPIPGWLGPRYVSEPVDLRVQALKETTGRSVTLLRRTLP